MLPARPAPGLASTNVAYALCIQRLSAQMFRASNATLPGTRMISPLDPITLGVIQAGLQQVCDEMDLAFSRSAFSPVIAEADDRSDGIYAATDGSLISQGSRGLPVFVGTMQFSTRHILERIAAARPSPPTPATSTSSTTPTSAAPT